MKTYFAYVRVSTPRQGEQGTSPQEQKHAIAAYAARHRLEISKWYEERETAAKRGRPQFNTMLRDIRRKKPAGIIVHKIDRSARNLGDWSLLLDLVDDGTEVHFAHETVDLTSRGGRLTANIQAVMAADYSRNLSDEVRKGQLGRLRQGLFPLRAPRGYTNPGPAKVKEIDPIEGPLVREAFELYATGQFSVDALRHEMERRGLRQKCGGPLSRGYLTYMLHNPFYIGLMRLSTFPEVFAGNHAPLISRELFEQVQRMMAGKGSAKIQVNDFLFRRRVRCAACNRVLTGELKKGRVYYRCHSDECRGTSAREDALSNAVLANLLHLYLPSVELGDFRDVLQELINEERTGERDRMNHVARDIAKINERLSLLTDALLSQTVDDDTYRAKKEELLLTRRSLEEVQERGHTTPFWERVAEKFEQGFVALPRYESANLAEQRDVLDTTTSNFRVRAKEPVHTLVWPLDRWADWTKSQEGWHSRADLRTRVQFRQFLDELKASGDPSN